MKCLIIYINFIKLSRKKANLAKIENKILFHRITLNTCIETQTAAVYNKCSIKSLSSLKVVYTTLWDRYWSLSHSPPFHNTQTSSIYYTLTALPLQKKWCHTHTKIYQIISTLLLSFDLPLYLQWKYDTWNIKNVWNIDNEIRKSFLALLK